MEKAFAYVRADESTPVRLLKKYCRKIYELGYIPICPRLSDSQYLAMESADKRLPKSRSFAVSRSEIKANAAEAKLPAFRQRRNGVLVACGSEITGTMAAEIRRVLQNNTTYQRGQNMKHTHKCKCAYWPRRHAAG